MLRKLTAALLLAALALYVVGCCVDRPAASADKAVRAYTELYTTGDSPVAFATGMTEEQRDLVARRVAEHAAAQFGRCPLSDENLARVTEAYLNNVRAHVDVHTELVEEGGGRAVVHLTANVVNANAVKQNGG